MNSIELRKLQLKKMTPEQQSEARIEDVDDLRLTLDAYFNTKCNDHVAKFGKDLRALETKPMKRMEKNM